MVLFGRPAWRGSGSRQLLSFLTQDLLCTKKKAARGDKSSHRVCTLKNNLTGTVVNHALPIIGGVNDTDIGSRRFHNDVRNA